MGDETAHSRMLRSLTQLGHKRFRHCPATPDALKKAMSAFRVRKKVKLPLLFLVPLLVLRCLFIQPTCRWEGSTDLCKLPEFKRHQRPFCDALCRGLLSRLHWWPEKLLLLARGPRRSVPGMSNAFLSLRVISTFRSIFVLTKFNQKRNNVVCPKHCAVQISTWCSTPHSGSVSNWPKWNSPQQQALRSDDRRKADFVPPFVTPFFFFVHYPIYKRSILAWLQNFAFDSYSQRATKMTPPTASLTLD